MKESELKIKDLEQKITFIESSPDIKKLLDMGFPIEQVRKALAANNNSVDAAAIWLLESSQV